MRILLATFSRSGHTAALGDCLAARLRAAGHTVDCETIRPLTRPNKWRLVPPLLPALPVLPLILGWRAFRAWWLRHYHQPQQDIAPLAYPDASAYDRVLIGGPKWLYLAYPVARYLQQLQGLDGRTVGVFATFCGPPLEAFEKELLFVPYAQCLGARGARLASCLSVSSGYHEFFFLHEMEWLFRGLSRLCFGRPLSSFGADSPWAEQEIGRFLRELGA
ncbi:hypothetical protein [Massilia sp. TS11]|uniref:hypothetical protein n=1 Tax=Massilia sp. TS11 TaxID=2908003 RepID=UPI001EDB576B|nr:hypothetical protein [Massilia sp. TS11]MCG2585955.1 hypothetical protein [Massilia sp. TS11]